MAGISTIELINSISVLILAALIAWARYREKKLTNRFNLGPNPERCARHEERLNSIEAALKEIRENLRKNTDSTAEIKERVIWLESKIKTYKQ